MWQLNDLAQLIHFNSSYRHAQVRRPISFSVFRWFFGMTTYEEIWDLKIISVILKHDTIIRQTAHMISIVIWYSQF